MTIKIKDFDWSQKDSTITIVLSLRNESSKKVDIVCTSSYLKVNFNPYIFELFLCHKIDPDKSTSICKDGSLHIKLQKVVEDEWESIALITKNKQEAQKLRTEALEEHEKREKAKNKEKKNAKITLERLAVSKQIVENENKLERHKQFVEEEKIKFFCDDKAGGSALSSKENRMRLSSLCSEDGSIAASEGDYDGDEESMAFSSSENLATKSKKEKLIKRIVRQGSAEEDTFVCPSIRESRTIRIRHSSHDPTVPKRESVTAAKNQENKEEKSQQEMNTSDKKEKLKFDAIKYFNNKEYKAAISSYSALIELCPQQASYYSNRAASYLAIKAYQKAVTDCSKALELLHPPTEENAKSRLLCYVRRGTCLVQMAHLTKGLKDYESAQLLDPDNVSIAKDTAVIKACLNSPTDSDTTEGLTRSSDDEDDV